MFKLTYSKNENFPIVFFNFAEKNQVEWTQQDLFRKFHEMGISILTKTQIKGDLHAEDIPGLLWSIKEANNSKKIVVVVFSVKNNLVGSDLEVRYADSDLDFFLNSTFTNNNEFKANLIKTKTIRSEELSFLEKMDQYVILDFTVAKKVLKDKLPVNKFGENLFQQNFRYWLFSLTGFINS